MNNPVNDKKNQLSDCIMVGTFSTKSGSLVYPINVVATQSLVSDMVVFESVGVNYE